jgi:hypothetical protein
LKPLEIDVAIITYLLTYSGLTALVSGRIFVNGAVPENVTFPYVSMFLVSGTDDECFITQSGFAEDTYQFTSAGLTKIDSINVAKQVRLALKDYSGIMGGTGGVNVQAILHDGRRDASYKRADGAVEFYRDEDFIFKY